MTPALQRRRGGLTLVEIVIAAAVLSILMVGLFSTMQMSQKSESLSREKQAATERAFREIDYLMSINFDELPSGALFEVAYDTGAVDGSGNPRVVLLRRADPYPVAALTGATSTHVGQITVTFDPPVDSTNGNTSTCGADIAEIRVICAWRPSDWSVENPNDVRLDFVTRRVRR